MPRPRNVQHARVAELSQHQQATIYGRGFVILTRGDRAWRLTDAEASALRVLIVEFQEGRTGSSHSDSSSPAIS